MLEGVRKKWENALCNNTTRHIFYGLLFPKACVLKGGKYLKVTHMNTRMMMLKGEGILKEFIRLVICIKCIFIAKGR